MIYIPLETPKDYTTRKSSATSKDVRHVDHSGKTQSLRRDRLSERRRRPDRRRQQATISGKNRRKPSDRRSPLLLNARSAKPEELHSRKGFSIDTKA
jgi:hypothetical protein